MNTQDTPEPTEAEIVATVSRMAEDAQTDIIGLAVNMAELMNQEQQDQMLAIMIVQKASELFTRDDFTEVGAVLTSPFNKGYAIGINARILDNPGGGQTPGVFISGATYDDDVNQHGKPEVVGLLLITVEGQLHLTSLSEEPISERGAVIRKSLLDLIASQPEPAFETLPEEEAQEAA